MAKVTLIRRGRLRLHGVPKTGGDSQIGLAVIKAGMAKERLPLCDDPCLIPACRDSLLMVYWSESQGRYTSGPLSRSRCLNANSKAWLLCGDQL